MKAQFMVISAVIAGLIMITVGSVIANIQSQTFEPEETSYDIRYLSDEAEKITESNTPSEQEIQNYRKLVMQTDFQTEVEYSQDNNCFNVTLTNPRERYDLQCLGEP